MRHLVMGLGLFVLGPTCVYALPISFVELAKETRCVEPAADPPETLDQVFKKQVKVKKKVVAKPKKMPDPTPEEVRTFVAANFTIDPTLVLGIVRVESNFHTMAVAIGKGSSHLGVMQIAPQTARYVGFKGKPADLYDWKINVHYGIAYLVHLQSLYRQTDAAVAAYNSGSPYYRQRPGKKLELVNQGYVTLVRRYQAAYRPIAPLPVPPTPRPVFQKTKE